MKIRERKILAQMCGSLSVIQVYCTCYIKTNLCNYIFLGGREVVFFLNSYTLVKSLKPAELCKAVLRLIRQESALWHSHPCERRTDQLLKSVLAGAWSSSHLFMSAVLTQEQETHPVLSQQQLLWKSEGRVRVQLLFIHQDLNYCEFSF